MYLDKLIVINTIEDKIIREVKFNKTGLSLIVDDTDSKTSGSNIGKTTAVKVIDLCLGANSVSSLYKEKDTGENAVVKGFLEKNKVVAELHVIINKKNYILKRPLYKNGKCEINNEPFDTVNEYKKYLNKLVFNNLNNKPTFRRLISKFVRLENSNESSLLKYLGTYIKQYEYQAIYEYLYGIDTSKSENIDIISLNESIDKDIEVIYRKNGVSSLEEFKTKIQLMKEETERLKNEYHRVSVIDNYEYKEEYIEKMLFEISKLEQELYKSKLKADLMKEKINKEREKIFLVDHKALKRLYDETKIILDKPLQDFEDLEKFHNGMVIKRIEMLEQSCLKQEKVVKNIEEKIDSLRKQYEINYVSFNSELREKFEEKVNEYTKNKVKLDSSKEDYDYIIKQMEEKKKNLGKKVKENDNKEKKKEIEGRFNFYFKNLTSKIIGEPFAIVLSNEEGEFPIKIIGMSGKPGTGIKKAMITCFDLAHIDLIIEKNYSMPRFEIHDKLENIDLTELKNIVIEGRNFRGQYIFPILKDRISEVGVKQEEIVLTLSKEEKFFYI
ncbi:DUF2326 domain-containing protein [Clostridioides difficile]|uniref:DUF2326 domain-containing protein n=1 Tax=Clostridioides difficile TaxID=1496 RepID=UPI0007BB5B22|nr:DUF2326 domain-containing protein [Clostridioides difficile]MBF9986777.1 DUF2326 domain-containing protein [Clostridioides difficile]MBH7479682.1 DUF2326 domain-containing protein [Clostridioides difficile]MCI2276340.1 DUF2326 domain-containing protein [Clostridioides difficile]MCM0737405.1 DUF2326 domain-containing protein [Clostridioides difficile]MCO4706371.1 DUF2326 domain-containing protein [Clostridioides difficile]